MLCVLIICISPCISWFLTVQLKSPGDRPHKRATLYLQRWNGVCYEGILLASQEALPRVEIAGRRLRRSGPKRKRAEPSSTGKFGEELGKSKGIFLSAVANAARGDHRRQSEPAVNCHDQILIKASRERLVIKYLVDCPRDTFHSFKVKIWNLDVKLASELDSQEMNSS